jgi:hypothetical protein
MIIRGFFVAAALALVVTGPGCGSRGPYDDPCLVGYEQLTVCSSGRAEEPDQEFLKSCRASPTDRCYFECYAEASCEGLLESVDSVGCLVASDFTSCIVVCEGHNPDWIPPCATPLVLSFDGAPVRFGQSDRFFDFGIGASVVTDWPSAATPWLALDRDGDGAIDDATELFGSSTPLQQGGRAANGFVALRELDTDGDGRLTPTDQAWASLLVWTDRNGDRVSSRDELASLESTGVTAIDLGFAREPRCDARGNCEGERAGFRFRDATGVERGGNVIDVYLRLQ